MPGAASSTDRDSGGILPVRLFCHTGSGKGVVPHRIRHGGNGGGTEYGHREPDIYGTRPTRLSPRYGGGNGRHTG